MYFDSYLNGEQKRKQNSNCRSKKKDSINILKFNEGEYTHFCLPTTLTIYFYLLYYMLKIKLFTMFLYLNNKETMLIMLNVWLLANYFRTKILYDCYLHFFFFLFSFFFANSCKFSCFFLDQNKKKYGE